MNTHFATSQRNNMRPLAFEGLLAPDCHSQLQSFLAASKDFLAQHGMPDAELFLAEPMHDNASGRTDWYTPAQEKPVPLAELSEAEQEQLLAKTQQSLDALTALSQSCAANNSMAASLLALATKHPGKEDIYSAGGTPVLINWGFEESSAASPEHIVRLGEKTQPGPVPPKPEPQPEPQPQEQPAPQQQAQSVTDTPPIPGSVPVQNTPQAAEAAMSPPPVPPAPAKSYAGCLPFLLPLLLALLLLWLLLAMLGLMPSPLPASCFHQAVPPASEHSGSGEWEQRMGSELARSRSLAQKAGTLTDRLMRHQALCVPKEVPKPAAKAPQTPPAEPVQPLKKDNPPQDKPVVPPAEPREESKPLAKNEMPDFSSPVVIPEEGQEAVPPKEESKPLAKNEMPDFGTPVVIPEEEKKPEPKPEPKPAPKVQAQAENKAPGTRPQENPKEMPNDNPQQDEPRPVQKAEKPKRGEKMQIPRDAAKNNDLSFLEGCWRSVTDLFSSATGEPIEAEYCFSSDGSGRRFIRQQDGSMCSGPARAGFNGRKLNITAPEAHCERGSSYVPQQVQCKGTEKSTRCHGKEETGRMSQPSLGGGLLGQVLGQTLGLVLGGSRDTWDATFIRK